MACSGLALWATTKPSTKRLKLLRNVESCINSNPFTTLMTYEDSAESFPYKARIVHTTENFKRPLNRASEWGLGCRGLGSGLRGFWGLTDSVQCSSLGQGCAFEDFG